MPLTLRRLEDRSVPAATAGLVGDGTFAVTGDDSDQRIAISSHGDEIVVRADGTVIGRFPKSVTGFTVTTGAGNDRIEIADDVTAPALVNAGGGKNVVLGGGGATTVIGGDSTDKLAGGSGAAALVGGAGDDRLVGGVGANQFDGGAGADLIVGAKLTDTVVPDPADIVQTVPNELDALNAALTQMATAPETLTAADVQIILDRASAATGSRDAIIAVVDRNGRILGVRVEDGVATEITADTARLVFAIDGAVAKAVTGAYFASDQAPLTSRTIQNLSQSTITQREVESNPNITDPNSAARGPGYVAAVGLGGHFPPGIANTPPVDLFGIEHTNRDGRGHPGNDRIKGTADDVMLNERFNINPAHVPAGQNLYAPDSYGVVSGLLPGAQNRGIATLPGGIPIFKNGQVVGGIGVFFPGKTGFATDENNVQSTTYDPAKPDRTLEAEYAAFVAVGGSRGAGFAVPGPVGNAPALPAGFDLPGGPAVRIDLVGITLNVFGPGGTQGPKNLIAAGQTYGLGTVNGADQPIGIGPADAPIFLQDGRPVPFGWLVTPHDGDGITAQEVTDIIVRGLYQATETRAAIRQIGSTTRMVFAVTDRRGNVVGLYRMPDATVFSIDVAVAKARNVMYYADAAELQPIDQVAGVPAGTAFTNRTFRYLAQPRFPEGIDTRPPGPFSILQDGNSAPLTALLNGPPKPASAFQSVYGFDSFNPGTNFRDPTDVRNQNGIVFFPGSAPVFTGSQLSGGFGVSGDGVDQDDVVTFAGSKNVGVPVTRLRADQVKVGGVRLPYQKFNRNPEGGV
ncbi:MAG: hypothetical protein ACRC7O_00135 [Fimbriiglobus sp.]